MLTSIPLAPFQAVACQAGNMPRETGVWFRPRDGQWHVMHEGFWHGPRFSTRKAAREFLAMQRHREFLIMQRHGGRR